MRFPLAVPAVAIIAVAIAACGGGGTSQSFVASPSAAPLATGAIALAQSGTTVNIGTANGITGALTFGAGTGQIVATSSSVAPSGTVTVVPAAVKRSAEGTSATSPIVYYVTISSIAGATISGLPGVSLALPTAAIGTYQEAQFTNGAWTNVAGATPTLNAAATALTFPLGTTKITIPAGGSIFLAFYQGTYPVATPTPLATPVNVIVNSDFEGGAAIPYPGAVGSTGWTQCTISKAETGITPNRAFSTFTPAPSTTPGAIIASAGTAVPQGTGTPAPTVTSVVASSGTHAALFGGVFQVGTGANQYALEDFRYNGLCQTVTIPKSPTLTMNLLAQGNQSKTYFDFEVDVLDANGLYVGNIYEDSNPDPITATSSGDSTYRAVTVPSSALTPYVGQTVNLFVGVFINGSSTAYTGYYFLDDFLLMGLR